MKPLILLTFALLLGSATASAAHTCGCTFLNKSQPGAANRTNWRFQRGANLAAVRRAMSVACRRAFGRPPVQLICLNEGRGSARPAPKRESWRESEAEERAHTQRTRDYIEETKQRNRRDEIDRVLEDARRRGVL